MFNNIDYFDFPFPGFNYTWNHFLLVLNTKQFNYKYGSEQSYATISLPQKKKGYTEKVSEFNIFHEYIKSFLMLTISLTYYRDYMRLIWEKHATNSLQNVYLDVVGNILRTFND